MGRKKNINDSNSVIFYKSTYQKPKNFKKYKIFDQIMCSYDIMVNTNRSIDAFDVINLNIPYEIDVELDVITINENIINDYIEDIIGVPLEEFNIRYFKRDGISFPFISDIFIYHNKIDKYFEYKTLRFRKYKLNKLINRIKC